MSARPFVVHVTKLRRAHGTRRREKVSSPVTGLVCSGSRVPEGTDVELDVFLEAVSGGVSVAGRLTAPWVGECRRCLAPATGTLELKVLEHFTEEGDGSDTYPLANDELDLEPLVHDAILLELPQAPLCRPDCRGLCPVCGVDLNSETCTCDSTPKDPRWAALGALRFTGSAERGSAEGPDEL